MRSILKFLKRLGLWQLCMTAIAAPFSFTLLAGGDSVLLFTPVGVSLAVFSTVAGAFLALPLAFFCAVLHSVAAFQRQRRARFGRGAAEASP